MRMPVGLPARRSGLTVGALWSALVGVSAAQLLAGRRRGPGPTLGDGQASPDGTRRPRRVLIVSGSVGAGHDGPAAELARRLETLGVGVDRRDYLDALPRWSRYLLRDGYTVSVNYVPPFFEWLFRSIEHDRWMRPVVSAFCRLGAGKVRAWTGAGGYAVVVSTFPLACQTLGQLKAAGRLDQTVITFVTDPAVHRLWLHRGVDHYLTVTEATARLGQAAYGVRMRTAGPLVPPCFAQCLPAGRRAELRAELGLPAATPVALVMAGSLALGDVPAIVQAVRATRLADVLVLCGRNERLRRRLDGRPGVVALGWRTDVHELMGACDVLVHNAGGLSLTEGLVVGLPAVTYAPLPGHGGANAAVLHDAGLAPWARDPADLARALHLQLSRQRVDGLDMTSGIDPARLVARLAGDSAGQVALQAGRHRMSVAGGPPGHPAVGQ